MVYNHKTASEHKYPLQVNGQLLELSEEQIGHLIKKKLKNSRVVNEIFYDFGVSIDSLDDLIVEIKSLDGIFAETDATTMSLDPSIIKDILGKNFFIILHEICGHYTTRKSEERGTFADPEEVFGMLAGCAGMLEEGYDFDEIYNIAWPKIGFHFHDERDGLEMMRRMFEKAKKMVGR